MNVHATLSLISVIAGAAVSVLLPVHRLTKTQGVLMLYSAFLMLWGLSTFSLQLNFFPDLASIFYSANVFAAVAMNVIYYHFVRTFTGKKFGASTYLGYAALVGLYIFFSWRGVLDTPEIVGDISSREPIVLYYLISFFSFLCQGMLLYWLIKAFKKADDTYVRNRIGYLLVAISILIIYNFMDFVPLLRTYYLDRIGHVFNIIVIGYAIMGTHQFDIKFVIRRLLAYTVVITLVCGSFTAVVNVWYEFLIDLPFYSLALFLSSSVLLLALAVRPLTRATERNIDRLFYRGTHPYRYEILNLAAKIGNILNLDELTSQMLPTLRKAFLISEAKLFVEDDKGDLTSQFAYPEINEEGNGTGLRFNTDSLIRIWLSKESRPLEVKKIDSTPDLAGMPEVEKEQVKATRLELLCPIKSRGKLVGILALGTKQTATSYTVEDIQLITTLTSQVGLMIENARVYTQALSMAVTDALTGLYNHRHFHKLVDQEIARCSRYGFIFSLVFIDVDHFKAYNDTLGHLAGDRLLRELGECISSSTRDTDTAFRYGGEEFAVILPETPVEKAYSAAERIRKSIEMKTSKEIMSVTASFGIATWPVNGITKEALIANADAAMYLAKQTGRNKTCLASEIVELKSNDNVRNQFKTPRAVYALAAAIDAKDHYTYGHSKKVADYSIAIGNALGLNPEKIDIIRDAGLLHDVGKIAIPDYILKKDEVLTEDEMNLIKTHPKNGVEIVEQIFDLNSCLPAILHHHEHFDGKGYPAGLRGDDIPLEARIVAIADAYDALTSERHYRIHPLSHRQALEELKRCSGTQFDPALVDVFCCIREANTLPVTGQEVFYRTVAEGIVTFHH